jgi:hypothetical protein
VLLLNECLLLLLFISLSTQSGNFWIHLRTRLQIQTDFVGLLQCVKPGTLNVSVSFVRRGMNILCVLPPLQRMKTWNEFIATFDAASGEVIDGLCVYRSIG